MSDFAKGLLLGVGIMIGCGTFIATTSKETSKDRYVAVKNGSLMLDKWEGKMYIMDPKSDDGYWKLIYEIKSTENE
tara:strand:+ start:282 stop:509 length:228 start_codon:yes stop_codon:yes gene_type:complete